MGVTNACAVRRFGRLSMPNAKKGDGPFEKGHIIRCCSIKLVCAKTNPAPFLTQQGTFFLPSSAAVRRSETALLRKKKIQNQTKKRWSSEKDELPEKIAHLKERVVAKKNHLISTNYEKKSREKVYRSVSGNGFGARPLEWMSEPGFLPPPCRWGRRRQVQAKALICSDGHGGDGVVQQA